MSLASEFVDRKVVSLFRNGRSQAVRIPKEWEFGGEEAFIQRLPDGRLLLMPAQTSGLVQYLATAEPWTGGEFIEEDSGLPALDEVRFD